MADDVLLNKAAMIERAVARAREEYAASADLGLAENGVVIFIEYP